MLRKEFDGVTTGKFRGDLDSFAEEVDAPGFQGAIAGLDADVSIDQTAVSSNAQADTETRADGDAQRANYLPFIFDASIVRNALIAHRRHEHRIDDGICFGGGGSRHGTRSLWDDAR